MQNRIPSPVAQDVMNSQISQKPYKNA